MITAALLELVYLFVSAIALIFSSAQDVVLSPNIASAISAVSGSYSALNGIFPIDTLLAIVAFDLTFELAYFVYKLIRWGYQKVPGIN